MDGLPSRTTKTATCSGMSFLDLPRELRDVVYNLVLEHDSPIRLLKSRTLGPVSSRRAKTVTDFLEPCDATAQFALLRLTSRQVDREIQQLFFDSKIFYFSAYQQRYDASHLDSPAACFAFARIRQLVVEYSAPVSDDIFGYMCVQMTLALRCPVKGNGGWQLRRCPSYDHRNQRPPEQIYGSAEEAILAFLAAKPPRELLGPEGVKRIVGIIDKELLRVI